MEEELNENDLEDRLYAMLHHVDETEANVAEQNTLNDSARVVENSTVRRYWREPAPPQRYNTSMQKVYNPIQKINTPNEPPQNSKPKIPIETTKPKEEQSFSSVPSRTVDLSVFQATPPQNYHKSIEILENDDGQVLELESSDEDEVIEVALPPKPTITIESSDDETPPTTVTTNKTKPVPTPEKANGDRAVSASPVPSIVSSVSDEFIRGDCIALNISSKKANSHSFDFSLHGSDLLGQITPSKKKKRKRNKENVQSTPIIAASTPAKPQAQNETDECFATPKSKTKNKRQKTKSNSVHDNSFSNVDLYDSDSNQSTIDTNKKQQSYVVTSKSLPSADVYESDSSQPESIISMHQLKQPKPSNNNDVDSTSDGSINYEGDKGIVITPPASKRIEPQMAIDNSVVDLTDNNIDSSNLDDSMYKNSDIQENLVMANVTGFEKCNNYNDKSLSEMGKFGSTKIPSILYEDLDFNNLKGKERVFSKRKYSLSTLRAEMEKFYNESWGGEDFNHREIQKSMSRDKSLWMIDPKDRMPALAKRKVTCNYCNRVGHRDDKCRAKPPICYMCGSAGHFEPRCPAKICVNCGSPNQMYSSMCRNCCSWGRLTCGECGQQGHPASHCPDLWRRYHDTLDVNVPLEENHLCKKYNQMFCSGCTRRGHLVHSCRVSLPFSGLPINSPYVFAYNPIYRVDSNQMYRQFRSNQDLHSDVMPRNKRQSKSPIVHDTHANKRRNISGLEHVETVTAPKSPNPNRSQRKISGSKDNDESTKASKEDAYSSAIAGSATSDDPNKLPDFIPIGSSNHDKKGQMIQDNEVSDTTDIVTSSRIYVTTEIIDKLKTDDGKAWLQATTEKHSVVVQTTEVHSFLCIKGKVGDQEAFQSDLRDWTKNCIEKSIERNDELQTVDQSFSENIPKNRFNLLRKITKALASLKEDIGDPKALYKELTYLQNRHVQLLNCKVISPKQLTNNRHNINAALKKLNMVLLGQAGLADGSKHVLELIALQEKLCNLRQKHISSDVREEVGHHYHSIFSASPRQDYGELVQKYYVSNQSPNSFRKKKKEKLFKASPKRLQKKNFSTIPSPQKNPEKPPGIIQPNNQEGSHSKQPQVNKTLGKLAFFHRRLLVSKPMDTVLKKTRMELVRKLHSQMSSLSKATGLSSKTMKKTKKIQEQARMFLKNV